MSPPTAAPPRRYGLLAKLWNFFIVVVIFVLFGPPIGAFVFLGMLAVWIGKSSDPGAIGSVFAFLTIYGILFSWFVGGLPAALTGLAFATWQTFAGPVRWAAAALVGLAAGLLLAWRAATSRGTSATRPCCRSTS